MSIKLPAGRNLTPPLSRGARGVLGWTIDEFAATAGVGVSTVVSFESAQRVPMAANIEAMARAFSDAGIVFTEKTGRDGPGFKMTKSAAALRDFLMIGALNEQNEVKFERMKGRFQQYRMESKRFHESIPGRERDVSARIRSDVGTLRDIVDREIERRSRLAIDDQATHFLERVTDYLHSAANRF